MITLAELAILILACFRLSNFIVDIDEEGPYMIFDRIRHLLGRRIIDGKEIISVPNGPLLSTRMMIAEASQCMWCISVWFGMIIAFFYWLFPTETVLVMLPFALSVGAILIKKRSG